MTKITNPDGPECPSCRAKWVCEKPEFHSVDGYFFICPNCGITFHAKLKYQWVWVTEVKT